MYLGTLETQHVEYLIAYACDFVDLTVVVVQLRRGDRAMVKLSLF